VCLLFVRGSFVCVCVCVCVCVYIISLRQHRPFERVCACVCVCVCVCVSTPTFRTCKLHFDLAEGHERVWVQHDLTGCNLTISSSF